MRIFLTGIAGFIGMHVAQRLVGDGHTVAGVDNFNDYYDPGLKLARIDQLGDTCSVRDLDISRAEELRTAVTSFAPDVVVHLAAQAGVRYSLENPMAYVQANLAGHVAVLEACRALGDGLSHLVYASSSSVYGRNTKTPFNEGDPVDSPVSLYAATKRSDELISSSYAHLFGIKQVGLRLFTVYGPWGRPDMAYWLFTEKILKEQPIHVFNGGKLRRDFTWIGDIVSGVAATVNQNPAFADGERPHRLYNLGSNKPTELTEFIDVLENTLGERAIREFIDMQPGDVMETFADISTVKADYGFAPATSLADGLAEFVHWYRSYSER